MRRVQPSPPRWAQFESDEADCLVTVTDYDFHPLRAFTLTEKDRVNFKWQDYAVTRSQDLPKLVHDAGAFCFFNVNPFLKTGNLITENTIGYELPRKRVADIDTPEDLEIARILHRHQLDIG